ncbi:MAG: regulatory protein RecX [Anaerolineales bacterium]
MSAFTAAKILVRGDLFNEGGYRLVGVITALKAQKNGQRVNVFIDRAYRFSLDRSLAAGLRIGQALTDQEIAHLSHQDEEQRAYLRALRYLSRRPHAEKEIREKLYRNGFAEPVLRRTIDRLREAKLVDDAAFARAWVENRLTFRPRSARALRMELKRKGVPAAAIDQALDGFEEQQAARLAAEKGLRRYAHLEPETARQRLMAYLTRRGFDYSVVKHVLRDVMPEGVHSDAESEVSR